MNDRDVDPTTTMATSGAEPVTAATTLRDELLELRVATLIERHPEALQLLIDAGFGPLAVPALRKALAPTVTLRQALRIRSLTPEKDAELLAALEQVACLS